MKQRILYIVLLNILNVVNLNAQNLPKVQKATVNLPENLKIDGSASEWNNKFQAKNNSTNIFSTIANNGQSLYLVVHTIEPLIIKKIIGGGITFTICTAGTRDDTKPYVVTFPVIPGNFHSSIYSTVNEITPKIRQEIRDSLENAANNKIKSQAKTIKIKGFKTNDDTLISIYNNIGIKAAVQIDSQGGLTCEFMIPLKRLGIAENEAKMIAYNIMLNSPASSLQSNNFSKGGRTGVVISIPRSLSSNQGDSQTIQHPTDYWGKYMIAK